MVRNIHYVVLVLLGCMLPAFAQAQVGERKLHVSYKDDYMMTGSVVDPVYNPHTKSYFELRWATKGRRWRWVYSEAISMTFKGVPGRLAIINDLETHSFVQSNFRIVAPTWIGLRYQCGDQSLRWVNGGTSDKSSFSAWHYKWARLDDIRCGSFSHYASKTGENFPAHMGVSYVPLGQGKSSLWQASGPDKEYDFFLVEYPTGKE